MIKSMTGYGSGTSECGGKQFTVEVKSVNYRYSDFSIKLPRIYNFLEEPVRKYASGKINRGKVDIFINVNAIEESGQEVRADVGLARSYQTALQKIADELGIEHRLTAETFLRVQDVFAVERVEEDNEAILEAVLSALKDALNGFETMRIEEGKKLFEDLTGHLKFIEDATQKIEERSPQIVDEYMAKIKARMEELLNGASYDETRLLTEVAVFADKINVNEEIVRLESHIRQFANMLNQSEPVGRKIDFLIQEMNREINTIGSKSNDLDIARIVIDVKAEIEKLREQIQNVE